MCDNNRVAASSAPASMHCESSRRSPLHSVHSIRQVDADILEQGVEEKWGAALADFDDEGWRLEAYSANVSLVDLDEDNDGKDFEFCSQGDGCTKANMADPIDESTIDQSPRSSATYISSPSPCKARILAASSHDNIYLPAINEHTSSHIPLNEAVGDSRPQILNRSITESHILLNGLSVIDHEALLQRIASGRASNRSDSFDRRKSESAQFAEAVGEEPDSLLLQKIVEDDSSSDFDDNEIDEEGVHLILENDQVELRDFETVSDKIQVEMNSFVEGEVVESMSVKFAPRSVSTAVTLTTSKEGEISNDDPAALPVSFEAEIKDSMHISTSSPAPCNENHVFPPNLVYLRKHTILDHERLVGEEKSNFLPREEMETTNFCHLLCFFLLTFELNIFHGGVVVVLFIITMSLVTASCITLLGVLKLGGFLTCYLEDLLHVHHEGR